MSEWKEYCITDVCDTISETYKDGAKKVVLINTSDVLEGKITNHKFVDNNNLAGQFKKKFQKDDILYSEIRPANRRYAYVDIEPKDYIASTKLMVLRNKPCILPMYLYYLLTNNSTIRELHAIAVGRSGTFPQITYSELSNIKFQLPPIEKQERILSILLNIDSKIETNRKICANLEAQAQALFKHWFIDFAPFKDGKFVESELGMIPEGWRVGSPYEYLDFIYGAPYKSNLFNDKKEGLPLIRIRDLKDCSPQFYTPEVLPKSEYVKAGDILAGMDAEFAPYIWKGQQGLLNQRVCKIKPKRKDIGRFFCMLLVKPQLLFVQAVKTGTTVSHIGKSDIDRFKAILPPLNEVIRFSKLGEEILDEIITVSAESSRLSTLRDTLLPKLMSGEIKV